MGNDRTNGDAGDDTLCSGTGDDEAYGGEGTHHVVLTGAATKYGLSLDRNDVLSLTLISTGEQAVLYSVDEVTTSDGYTLNVADLAELNIGPEGINLSALGLDLLGGSGGLGGLLGGSNSFGGLLGGSGLSDLGPQSNSGESVQRFRVRNCGKTSTYSNRSASL